MKNRSKRWLLISMMAIVGCASALVRGDSPAMDGRKAGSTVDGALAEPDGKMVRPAGESVAVPGKPVDVVFTPDGSLMLVKSAHGLSIIDAKSFAVVQTLVYKDKKVGGSMHGLAVAAASGGGWTVYFTSSVNALLEAHVAVDGTAEWGRRIPLSDEQNWGIALSADGKLAYVCQSIKNTLSVVNLEQGKVISEIPVAVAPYDVVLSPDGKTAYVSNFGGSHPKSGQTEKSAGTDVAVDERDIPISGTVSKVDLVAGASLGEIKTGLHPTQIVRDAKGERYYVACANSDGVSVIDAKTNRVAETIDVKPDAALGSGSIPDGIALSPDEKTLYVANGGNDAVAVVALDQAKSTVQGFIPAGWFPGGVTCHGDDLFIANTLSGRISKVAAPAADQLKTYTAQVLVDENVPQMLRQAMQNKSGVKPVVVPAQPGEPSLIKHVVYILRENKTYDQVLGDIGKGNSEPKYANYGNLVTPNAHAMANQFVLLDNYYCNGVNSSEGHQWATQGIIGEYFEKGSRTYDFGTDALCYANCDFIWDSCLLHGLTIRNYGEFDFPSVTGKSKSWFDIYNDWKTTGTVSFKQSVEFGTLMHYTCKEYAGWNLSIPDVSRAKVFLKEFEGFEKSGEFPNFVLVYLPQDHTSGTKQTVPSPRAMVADNDLATGQVVEAITKSKFWKDTCIFINEDDPQSGYDHVDGHRSICLVLSPYAKHEAIISKFYNQTSVLHTMTQMLGIPPMNQHCAAASTMEDCFTETADLRPYQCVTNTVALDEKNPKKEAMAKPERDLADAVDQMDFSRPDLADEDKMNRLAWLASGRTDPYPAEFAGPHGKGLAKLHLKLDKTDADGDDDGD